MTSVTCSVNNNQHFQQPAGNTLFTATISDSNAAFLDDTTVPLAEYASAATTLPLDLDLWHRRLAHHHLQDVKHQSLGRLQLSFSKTATLTTSHQTRMTLLVVWT